MSVMIANKADRTAANGVGLPIEHMNASAMFNNHNLMKIMMMFRKSGLRKPGFNGHGRFT
ncbi:hypothetical protein HMPREF0208_01409 [Citrobacter koseri]|nr:hypothetical protein HMPREF3207_02249 [Citrobacter koseri]KXA03350.1 hypothetical protein HMPREF3220_00722 [Citrobacter koseri]KXB45377.1 hypothetical protein HMPREF0208_01409 [Citrobacter koseri]